MLQPAHLQHLLQLRCAIGLLGESQPEAWWPSAFFSGTSAAFLSPMFSKTLVLARYHGVREAATRVHDEHIGIGQDVFHVFRLPERFERALHEFLHDVAVTKTVADTVRDQATAEQFVQEFSNNTETDSIGPVRIGSIAELETPSIWHVVAQHYRHAFHAGAKVFPYFTNE